MKQFAVNVDVTMSTTLYVEAESEEQAKDLARGIIYNDPYEVARTAKTYVDHFIVDAYEVDD